MADRRDIRAPERVPLADLPDDELTARPLPGGRKVIVLRRGGEVRCFGEVCPHMGADLADADYDPVRGTLRCAWHGYLFSADDGRLLENPNERIMAPLRAPSVHFTPDRTPAYRLTRVPCRVEGDTVIVGREDDTP